MQYPDEDADRLLREKSMTPRDPKDIEIQELRERLYALINPVDPMKIKPYVLRIEPDGMPCREYLNYVSKLKNQIKEEDVLCDAFEE